MRRFCFTNNQIDGNIKFWAYNVLRLASPTFELYTVNANIRLDKRIRLCYAPYMINEPGNRVKYILIVEVDDVRCFKGEYYNFDHLEEEEYKAEGAAQRALDLADLESEDE